MILTSGCFDGLHYGHVSFLQRLRDGSPGSLIVVAVACDEYIVRAKGRQPKWTLADRVAVMRSIKLVDEVVWHGPDGAADAIRFLRPHVFAKGHDWSGRLPEDVKRACRENGCGVRFIESGVEQHTSDALSPQ